MSEPEGDTSVEELRKPRAQKRKRSWELVEKFEDEEDLTAAHKAALKYIKDAGQYSLHYSNDLKKGRKVYYRCNHAKRRGVQCNAGLYALYPDADNSVWIYKTTEEHSHEELPNKIPFNKEDRATMKALYEAGDDSRRIWESYGRTVLQNKRQLSNLLATFRTETHGATQITVEDLRSWCEAHGRIPANENDLFVLDTDIDDDARTVRVLLSTKKLLGLAGQSRIVHADGTYKLMWQGFPLIVVGTTDANRKFVPTAFAICTGETTADYGFVFKGLQQAYTLLNIVHDFK